MVRWLAVNWKLTFLIAASFVMGILGIRMYWVETRLAEEKAYRRTRESIDEAPIYGDDPAAARRWLHERKPTGSVFRHRK
jgi:hypothetical protein